jgi:isopentenyldiphosphate isomerase
MRLLESIGEDMELWDLYDHDRKLTGKTIKRGDKIPQGYYHMVVHVCIFNSKGEMLIQQRQPFKKGWSNMWDLSMGGSAQLGDTSREAAERETFEELGLSLDLAKDRPVLTIPFSMGYDDIYIVEKDIDLQSLKLQYEEVQQVKWAGLHDILRMIEEGTFIPYHKSLISLLFDLRITRDAHSNLAKHEFAQMK